MSRNLTATLPASAMPFREGTIAPEEPSLANQTALKRLFAALEPIEGDKVRIRSAAFAPFEREDLEARRRHLLERIVPTPQAVRTLTTPKIPETPLRKMLATMLATMPARASEIPEGDKLDAYIGVMSDLPEWAAMRAAREATKGTSARVGGSMAFMPSPAELHAAANEIANPFRVEIIQISRVLEAELHDPDAAQQAADKDARLSRVAAVFAEIDAELAPLAAGGVFDDGFRDHALIARDAAVGFGAAYARGTGLAGLSSGFRVLDRFVGGFGETDLTVLAGRPGMGKTALATNIAFNVARAFDPARPRNGYGGRVGFFSLEMSDTQIANREIASAASMASHKLRRGDFHEDDIPAIRKALLADAALAKSLSINQRGAIPIDDLVRCAKSLARRQSKGMSDPGLELLVVDYLQLVTTTRKGGNRNDEIGEVSAKLKAFSMELHVPVLALAQLNRATEASDDKRPELRNLKDSGNIEQDADTVMFVHREEYFLRLKQPPEASEGYAKWAAALDKAKGVAEIIVGKSRHSGQGVVQMSFDGPRTAFSDPVGA